MTSADILLLHPSPDRQLIDSVAACGSIVMLTSHRIEHDAAIARYVYEPEDDLLALATKLAAEHAVRCVPALWEGFVETAAEVSARLRLAQNPVAAARASRDKHLAAACYVRAGVPHPRTLHFDVRDDIDAIEASIAYPFVVKLPRSTNSQSVTLVRSREELATALARNARLYEGGASNRLARLYANENGSRPLLAQDYVSGIELNVDLLYGGGEFRVTGIFEKYPMEGPTFAEVQSVYPVSSGDLDLDSCVATSIAAVRALGATNGAAHVELRLTAAGPVVIETALRPGGFYTPQAIRLLTGIDSITALTQLLLTGELPDVGMRSARGACLYGAVNVAVEGCIRHIEGVEVARALTSIVTFEMLKSAGDWIAPLPASTDYHVARFILAGADRETLEHDAEQIRRSIVIELETARC